MTPVSEQVVFLGLLTFRLLLGVFDAVPVLTHKGVSMLARYLAALYVILPQLDTTGLRGVLFLCILGDPYDVGCSSDSGHSFQYSLSEIESISLPLP